MNDESDGISQGFTPQELPSGIHICQITAVCQYDACGFGGTVILDILRVHPFMVMRGSVIQNPFFIPPEEFLAR